MPNYKCQSCSMEFPMCGDGLCPCGGDLVPVELKRVDIPLAYPQLASVPYRLPHDEWCKLYTARIKCEDQHCIQCEIAYTAGTNSVSPHDKLA